MKIIKTSQPSKNILQLNLTGFVIGLGILVRLYFFLIDRSLWLDEVYLATSVVKMNLKELLTTELYYYQKAPLGYLLVQKIIITIFGASEKSLRLFSLACSIAALFLFVRVSKYFLREKMVWLAAVLFTFAAPLVFHSVEAKAYSVDLLATLIALYLYINYRHADNLKQLIYWGLYGSVLIWFSYPVIFVLAGIAIAICIQNLINKKRSLFIKQLLPFALWLMSFSVNFLLSTRRHTESEWTVFWFDQYEYFAPVPPSSINDLKWYVMNFYWALTYPLGVSLVFMRENIPFAPVLKMSIIPAIMLIIGFFAFIKKHIDFYVVITILFITLLASGLHMYPLKERFLIFLSPIFIWLIVKGCYASVSLLKKAWLKTLLIILIAVVPVISIIYLIIVPGDFLTPKNSYQKQALKFVKNNFKEGDVLFVYWNNKAPFELYNELHNYPIDAVIAKDHRKNAGNFENYFRLMKADLDQLPGTKRVWLLYDEFYQSDIGEGIDWPAWYFKEGKPTDTLIRHFRTIGKPAASFKSFNISAICFELKVK